MGRWRRPAECGSPLWRMALGAAQGAAPARPLPPWVLTLVGPTAATYAAHCCLLGMDPLRIPPVRVALGPVKSLPIVGGPRVLWCILVAWR